MHIKHPSRFYDDLKGLPGVEERLYHEGAREGHESYETNKRPKFWTLTAFFVLSVWALFLPLVQIDTSGIWQKIYYIGIVVSL